MAISLGSNEVVLSTNQGDVYGTLNCPPDPKFAVLFIGGSGPHDRDGVTDNFSAGYKEWCSIWADQGIATLRLDKPGSGKSPMPTDRPARYDHDLGRNQRALNYLGEEFPSLRLALIGHSLGALTMLEITHERLVGLAQIAGMGRTIDRVIAHQVLEALEKTEAPASKIQEHMAERLNLVETFKHGGVVKNMPPWAGEDPEPWIHLSDIAKRDPVALLSGLQLPLCLIKGTRDDRVYQEDWKMCRAAAPNAKALLVEDMDHFLCMPDNSLNRNAIEWVGEFLRSLQL